MRPGSGKTRTVSRRECAIAFVILAALLVLTVLGPAHLDRDSIARHDADHCATCAAILVLGTAIVVLAVLLLLGLGRASQWRPLPVRQPRILRRGIRLPAPRAPPFIA